VSLIALIRHGATDWNAQRRLQGRADRPLSDRGRAAVRSWTVPPLLRDAVWATSPLARARETAELVSPACGVDVDSQLVEWDYGIYEGRSTPDIREESPAWSVWTHAIKGGETIEQVGARVDQFLARVVGEVETGNAAVFAHGHVLAILIARWCHLAPIEGRRFPLATATVSLLGWHREDRVIRALNHRAGETLDPPSRT
jgi:broad specificity phosphatase PhoE